MQSNTTSKKPLIYKTGKNVVLVKKAGFCKSVIADGVELIPEGGMTGALVVPELKTREVYVTFKEEVTDFTSVFDWCRDLKEIPENLFANCTKAECFMTAFAGCAALKAIPEGLFAHNPKATSFTCTFLGCKSLTRIPEKLFAACAEVTSFAGTFCECPSLQEIPEGLFANSPQAEIFSSVFERCSSLETIPANLFAHNPQAKHFDFAFKLCSSLEEIPADLFAHNPKAKEFTSLFQKCEELTGETPYTVVDGRKIKLWERSEKNGLSLSNGNWSAFEGCAGLSDYKEIPSKWKM